MSGGKKFTFACWFDEWRLTFVGLKNVAPRPSFLIPAIISFVFFGTLLNLLSAGSTAFSLAASGGLFEFLPFIGHAFLKLFGISQTSFIDWAFSFLIALLQGILIGLVVFVFRSRRKAQETTSDDSANIQNAGIVAGLAILGSGCPTCGTTLLMPVIISIAGSSSMALASTVSWLLTATSIIVALLTMKKVGFETYAIIEDEKFQQKHDKIKKRSRNVRTSKKH